MKEVVIKMPDAVYDWFVNGFPDKVDLDELQRLVVSGTVLPAGHGELKDVNALDLKAIDSSNHGSNFIRMAQTIIEADKENRYEG